MLPTSATLVWSIETACVAGGFVSFGAHKQAAKQQGKRGGRKKKPPHSRLHRSVMRPKTIKTASYAD